jgi:predicted outer membrane repeat protein
MALPLSRFMIEDCLFEANSASLGGGLYSKNAAGTVNGCEFSGNTAKTKGGAVYAESSALTITNCVFSANTAGASGVSTAGGGAVFVAGAGVTIVNCTFYNNSTRYPANGGGAVYNYLAATVIANSILWGNTSAVGPQVHNHFSTGTAITHCDIDQSGFESGSGNIRREPLWADPDAGDFRLQSASPCIDAGTLEAVGLPELDFKDGPRVSGASVDIGALEFGD